MNDKLKKTASGPSGPWLQLLDTLSPAQRLAEEVWHGDDPGDFIRDWSDALTYYPTPEAMVSLCLQAMLPDDSRRLGLAWSLASEAERQVDADVGLHLALRGLLDTTEDVAAFYKMAESRSLCFVPKVPPEHVTDDSIHSHMSMDATDFRYNVLTEWSSDVTDWARGEDNDVLGPVPRTAAETVALVGTDAEVFSEWQRLKAIGQKLRDAADKPREGKSAG